VRHTALGIALAAASIACGKKGPPLPPLIRLPAAPADFTAERRGNDVKLQFTAPSANTDGSRPANIDHIDVYGFTGPFTANDDQLMKLGTKVATVSVKAPRNPDVATDAEEPPEEPELEDEGIDQGAVAQLEEPLTPASFTRVTVPVDKSDQKPAESSALDVPLTGPPGEVPWRIFLAVGISTSGKRGAASRRTIVPLVPPPAPPVDPDVSYDEHAAHVTWKPSPSLVPVQPMPGSNDSVLPARFFGMQLPSIAYHVYDVSPSIADGTAASAATLAGETRLTKSAVTATTYDDNRMDWGRTRCYTVRAFETITGQTLESEAPKPICVTLTDTFPPAAPKNLQHIASEGVISLIWEPNSEPDVAGYVVLRGVPPGDHLEPITMSPITATVFDDKVPPGMRYVYAVQAVDRAGNHSPASAPVEDAAR